MPPDDRPRIRLPRPARWFKRLMLAGAILGAVLGAVASFVVRTLVQPSGSMWPTLRLGERLVASRLEAPPERGAIVVFKYPEHPEQLFVKRIVGLPGDVIAITSGEVTVNGRRLPRCVVGKASFTDRGTTGDSGPKHEGLLAVEWLGAATYLVFDEQTGAGASGEGRSWTTAPGEYFVLGDNRNNSHDSRMWWSGAGGGVPFASTRGRVRGHAAPEIPAEVEGRAELAGALGACLAKGPPEAPLPAR
jgi:signal peptidase I